MVTVETAGGGEGLPFTIGTGGWLRLAHAESPNERMVPTKLALIADCIAYP